MAGEIHRKLKENIEFIKDHTVNETAEYLGVNPATVRSFINLYEIPHVRCRYPEPEYAMEILEYARSHSVKKAIEKYNVTRTQIHRWAKKHNVSVRNTERIRFFHGVPVQQVADEVNESSLRAVSAKYGVTYQRVLQILKKAGYEYKYVKTKE